MTAGLAGAVGLSATACGGGDQVADDVVLKLVAAEYGDASDSGSTERYWNELAQEFRQEHSGIRVDVSVFPWEDIDAEVAGLVRAGQSPDIAQLGSYADFAAAGQLYPVSELLSIPVQADFVPALAVAGEVRRVQYGMPFAASTRLLFYNKALFEDAGLDPKAPPETWEELAEAAAALKAAGVPVPYALPLGPEEAHGEALMWMLSGGGGLTDGSGSYVIDSPENVATFTWLRENLVAKGLTGSQAPAVTDRRDAFAAFAAGEVGMLNGHPSLMRQADRGQIEYGTGRLPGRNGPTANTMGVADWIMGFKQHGNREQIGLFLNFVFRKENVQGFADRYEMLPVTTPATQAMMESEEHERVVPFLQQLNAAAFYPVGKVSWAKTSTVLRQEIGSAMLPDSDIRGLLRSIQVQAEKADDAA
ncbi:extracellular solute-binding protein [Streptomyces sodiiphilus]|uniref:Extracellular solute-binding protein n=1 Tax=Streptomyces sodiiphilus TaxID=226217 RepID=A0ABN2NS19_9ACTN